MSWKENFVNSLPESKDRYKEAIEALHDPVRIILDSLREQINNGEYEAIIGEDVSGRIPTLVFSKVINTVYDTHERKHPEVRFFAGSRKPFSKGTSEGQEKEAMIRDQVSKLKNDFKVKKVLVVTDSISTAESILPIVEALRSNNIDFDIASIGLVYRMPAWDDKVKTSVEEQKALISDKLGATVHFGSDEIPLIFDVRQDKDTMTNVAAGVEKFPDETFSHSLAKEMQSIGIREPVQDMINSARENASTLAEKISEEYLSQRSM